MKNLIKNMVVVAAAGFALVACTQGQAQVPPSSSAVPTTTSDSSTSTPVSQPQPPTSTVHVTETKVVNVTPVLSGAGYGDIKLGTSYADLKKANVIDFRYEPPTGGFNCAVGTIKGTDMNVWVSTELGLTSITSGAKVATHTGIRAGTTFAELKAKYPKLAQQTTYYQTAAELGKSSYFFFVDNGKVSGITVSLHGQTCHN